MPRWRALSYTKHRDAARRCLVLVAALCGLLLHSAAAAESSGRVVIVGSATSPLVRRLREETEALGFSVDIKPEAPGPLADELETPDSVAAMRVLEQPSQSLEQPSQSLELVIVDPKLHQVFHDELPIRTETDPTAAELVATRALELLRAIRLGVPRKPEPVVIEQPPKETPVVQPSRATAGLSLAPLVNFAPGFELGASAEVSMMYVPQHVGVNVGVVVPVTSQRLRHDGGDLSASTAAIHAALVIRSNARAPFGLGVGLGLEAARVHFEGMASAPLVNAESTVLTCSPRLELIAALRLAPSLRLISPLSASYVLPHTVIRFAGEPLRDWGPVLLRFGLGMEWYWL